MSAEPRGTSLTGGRLEPRPLNRYFETLRQHLVIIILCVVVATGAAAVYAKTAPTKYSAQSEMLVSPVQGGDTALIGLPVLFSSGDPTRDVLTASSLIITPEVAARVVQALHLRESASTLLGQIQATPVGQSNLVAVQATASSAAEAQAIANAVPRQVIVIRAAALHAAIAAVLPGLQAQLAAQPAAVRAGSTLATQVSQLQQLQGSVDPTVTLASPAVLPTSPSSPKTKLAVVAGFLAGLILGIGAAFGFHALDPRLRREEQLRELLRIPVLARIPRERTRKLHRPLRPEELSFGSLEGLRTLRTILGSRARPGPRSYLVTGSSPGEGKSTSAIGLAAAFAQSGTRTLLIEADMRRPSIVRALGIHVDYGTEEVLSGEVELQEALGSAVVEGGELQVLAVKRPGADLPNRLTVPVAERLLEQALEIADVVVIDSPPLIDVSDALPLARVVDDVLIVARVGVSRLSRLSELCELLSHQRTYPAGVVLVGEARTSSYYDYYVEPQVVPDLPSDGRGRAPRERGEEPVGPPA